MQEHFKNYLLNVKNSNKYEFNVDFALLNYFRYGIQHELKDAGFDTEKFSNVLD